jgi:hypothetical protein
MKNLRIMKITCMEKILNIIQSGVSQEQQLAKGPEDAEVLARELAAIPHVEMTPRRSKRRAASAAQDSTDRKS